MTHCLKNNIMLIIFLVFCSVFLTACEDQPEKKTQISASVKQDVISGKIIYPEPLKTPLLEKDTHVSTNKPPPAGKTPENTINKSNAAFLNEPVIKKEMPAPNPVLTMTIPSRPESVKTGLKETTIPEKESVETDIKGTPIIKKENIATDAKEKTTPKKEGLDSAIKTTIADNESPLDPEDQQSYSTSALDDTVALMMGETKNIIFYTGEGRIDPFDPLIKAEKKSPVPVATEPEKPKRILTPLEKLDFSQMTLVAIINSETDSVAMVQESSGKGYVVKVGTYMGQNGGQVERIETDRIVIKEMVKNYKGLETTRFQELKLHKDKG